jgi:DNA-binding CsgD family transcriptional regulator
MLSSGPLISIGGRSGTLVVEQEVSQARTRSGSGGVSGESPAGGRVRELVGRERELVALEHLLETVRNGGSASLFVHGDPGIGKSALLERLICSATGFRVLRAIGVEGEIDLPYAGLQQLCRPLLPTIDLLPPPQGQALQAAFGLTSGEVSDRYLVGLAVLSLLSEGAATQPILCVVDDAQWLDAETRQALAFVARRVAADSVGLAIAGRERNGDLESLPVLHVDGLPPADARALLDSVVVGHLDGPVRERFLAETGGNPLALRELPRTLTAAEAATGVYREPAESLSSRIEQIFQQRVESLPDDTRLLLVLAAADPVGDPLLLHRAASALGISMDAADAAEEAGLIETTIRWAFCHPLVRSAAYRSASPRDRRAAHRALAEVTDAEIDPDRQAWHLGQAIVEPDEDVAARLEQTAARAKARGGLLAAGAFLERAATLTPNAGDRAARTLAGAETTYQAGSMAAVQRLLTAIDPGHLDELGAARLELLQAQLALELDGPDEKKFRSLLVAVERLDPLDSSRARHAHLLAVEWAYYLSTSPVLEAVAALGASRATATDDPSELMLLGMSRLLRQGYPAGTDLLLKALRLLSAKESLTEADLPVLPRAVGMAFASWDFDSLESLSRHALALARESGALSELIKALRYWADANVAGGDFVAAERALAEAETLADATGASRMFDVVQTALAPAWLAASRFEETEALKRIEIQADLLAPYNAFWLRAIAYNGAGRYNAAFDAAQRASDGHPTGTYGLALPELVEAAVRCGKVEDARAAFEALRDRTQRSGTDWALGLEARCNALLTDEAATAEPLYREAVELLGRARTLPDLGRTQLVYGEWLRREQRRVEAREQLHGSYALFCEIGMQGYAERARRELAATGETSRKRTDETRADLTPQEIQIALLALEGLTNPQIGARLFLSARTIEWHLRHIYPKLGIRSRRELHTVTLPT